MPMNTANKLTLLRVFLIPVFLVVAYWGFPGSRYVALAIYIVACLTDLLDGYIARHYNQVSDFGKFADPLADKCLVIAGILLCIGFRYSVGFANFYQRQHKLKLCDFAQLYPLLKIYDRSNVDRRIDIGYNVIALLRPLQRLKWRKVRKVLYT